MSNGILEIDKLEYEKEFSVCTLVNNFQLYLNMVKSFRDHGFSEDICEFIYVDNERGNKYSASAGLNKMISMAKGKYVICCHQDIELIDDVHILRRRLEELNDMDPYWGLAGNAGGRGYRETYMHITTGDGKEIKIGNFPERVDSLDENFVVIRKEACLGFSVANKGFHMYGADICMDAHMRGFHIYVVDFHLKHFSGGKLDRVFWGEVKDFERRYRRFFRTRWLTTTCAQVPLTASNFIGYLMHAINPWGKRWKKIKSLISRYRQEIQSKSEI